ncbi:MAG: hypothetical protein QOH67_4664 [Hyphomicrobiales bacterium]|nr:hypothetical protein [Hyphomicrobiales bacterium]
MSGRPVRLLAAATVAAAASLLSISTASAGCYSGCGGGYAAPVAYYSAPVVYSYSYAAPVRYASPCSPCGGYGYGSYGYAPSRPMYVVNQGPTYTDPVVGEAEGVVESGYGRPYPYLGEGGVRWHRRHWQRGYGYRGYRHGLGYRHGFGLRHGYRHHGFRYGGRYSMRHPMVGPGGIYRGPRYRTGLIIPKRWGGAIPPRHWNAAVRPHHMGGGGGMHIMRQPGVVHPRPMGGGAPKKLP